MDCEHCKFWLVDRIDAMGYCSNSQSIRGLTAPTEWCSNFEERPNTASSPTAVQDEDQELPAQRLNPDC